MRKKPVQQRSRQMVEAIIDASAKVVAEEGLDALTTNRVAEVAGISNGSLYQYFHDRQDLLEALSERVSKDIVAMFNPQRPQLETGELDPRTVARLTIKVILNFLRTKPLYLELIRNWGRVPLQPFLEPMERYWVTAAQQYLLRQSAGHAIPDLHVRLHVLFNSAVFNLLRFVGEEHPMISEDALVDALASNIEATLMLGVRNPGKPDPGGA